MYVYIYIYIYIYTHIRIGNMNSVVLKFFCNGGLMMAHKGWHTNAETLHMLMYFLHRCRQKRMYLLL